MGAVVSAFYLLGAGDIVEFEALFEAVDDDTLCLVLVGCIEEEQIETRSASHRSEVDYFVLDGAIAHYGCEQVFHGVH